MAYKNNLLEYYGGGSVPYRQGYQGGGSIGNSLLGMQYGGYAGGNRALSNIGRFRSISKATADVQRRAKQIKSKKKKGGFWGKVLGKAGEWGGKALLGGALSTVLGPGLGLLAAKTIGSGVGGFLGAKLGYGKKVGTGLDKSKWLAGERKKLGSAEGDLGDYYMDIAGKQAAGTAKAGGKKFLKDVGSKTWGEYGQKKLGELGIGKYASKFEPDVGETPMGGGLALPETPALGREPFDYQASGIGTKGRASESPLGGLLGVPPALDPGMGVPPQYGGEQFKLPSITPMEIPESKAHSMVGGFNIPSLGDPTSGADTFEYAQSGFGAQAGQHGLLGGMLALAEGGSDVLQRQPWAQAGYEMAEPLYSSSLGDDIITGQYSPWGNITSGAYAGPAFNEGGMVRDDRALIDMLYRR